MIRQQSSDPTSQVWRLGAWKCRQHCVDISGSSLLHRFCPEIEPDVVRFHRVIRRSFRTHPLLPVRNEVAVH